MRVYFPRPSDPLLPLYEASADSQNAFEMPLEQRSQVFGQWLVQCLTIGLMSRLLLAQAGGQYGIFAAAGKYGL
jgi:hypothetical protein